MMNGFLNVNKPKGITSHDVVDEIRKLVRRNKVGHTGTLDSEATGVLPMAIGRATKVIQFLKKDKEYRAIMRLGIITDTQDITGKVIAKSKKIDIPEERVRKVFLKFLGKIEQLPPIFSALKVRGKRLYKLAREGKSVERPKRAVEIYNLNLLEYKPPDITLKVSCSKGTYIRTLCHDIGKVLGCGACLKALVRTKSGIFTLEESHILEELRKMPHLEGILISMDSALAHLPIVRINEKTRESVLNGGPIEISGIQEIFSPIKGEEIVRIHNTENRLLAVARALFNIEDLKRIEKKVIAFKPVRVLGK
jgi:tRNA pseudouridine55 synthase